MRIAHVLLALSSSLAAAPSSGPEAVRVEFTFAPGFGTFDGNPLVVPVRESKGARITFHADHIRATVEVAPTAKCRVRIRVAGADVIALEPTPWPADFGVGDKFGFEFSMPRHENDLYTGVVVGLGECASAVRPPNKALERSRDR